LTRGTGRARTLTPGVVPIPHGLGRHRRHGHRHRRRHPPHLKLVPAPPSGGTLLSASLTPVALPRLHRHSGLPRLLLGLLLALGSAALINLGFLLQHRGLGETGGGGLLATLRGAWRNPTWLGGQLLGWIGFAVQIIAVAIAPLALVQSFAAGGLALSVPLAAWLLAHRIKRAQVGAVLLIAAALAVLPIGFGTGRDHLHTPALAIALGLGAVTGLALSAGRRSWRRALAAGVFYGLADAAIKAISVGWSARGASAMISGWTVVAAVATFGGFVAFQAALRQGGAIAAISLMSALTALVALACGAVAFGESLGTDAIAVVVHLIAIAIVLGCVPLLAQAQAEMAHDPEPTRALPGPQPLRPTYESPGQPAPDREAQRLEPWPETRRAVHEDVAEAQVAGQRGGGLRGEEQREQPEQAGDHGPAPWADPDQQQSGQPTGEQPADHHAEQRLAVEPGELQERQRIADARTGAEPAQTAQNVDPTEAREKSQQHRDEETGDTGNPSGSPARTADQGSVRAHRN
jgi:hypothetical protein